MTTHKGFGLMAVVFVIAGLLVLGGGAYVVMHPQAVGEPGDEAEQQADRKGPKGWIELDSSATPTAKTSISWKLNDMDFDANNTPHTEVIVYVDGKEYVVGTFQGSCTEVGASGGVDGKGLLAGELSAVQCSWGDDGSEIGVFAHEDGGYQIMVGALGTGEGRYPSLRGDFKIKADIKSTIPSGAI